MNTLKRRHREYFAGSTWWMHSAVLLLPMLVLLSQLSGCKSHERHAPPPAPSTEPETELVVFAAASLKETFSALGTAFEQSHSGVKVIFNFAGTQELRTQVEQGASMDVFASADQKHLSALLAAKHVAEPKVFARNEPVIVVAKERRGQIHSLADLPQLTRIVLGTPDVPIGRYSIQLLENGSVTLGADFRQKVEAKVVSRELNVRQVLAKVRLGEAEAGIVYRTDTTNGADEVGVVAIAKDVNVIADYPIAIAARPTHPVLAKAWIGLVLSPRGQEVLKKAGFSAPESQAP